MKKTNLKSALAWISLFIRKCYIISNLYNDHDIDIAQIIVQREKKTGQPNILIAQPVAQFWK